MSPGNMFILSWDKPSLLGKKDLKKRTKRIQSPSRQISSSSECYPSVFTVKPLFDVRRPESDHRSIVYHWPDNSQSWMLSPVRVVVNSSWFRVSSFFTTRSHKREQRTPPWPKSFVVFVSSFSSNNTNPKFMFPTFFNPTLCWNCTLNSMFFWFVYFSFLL